MKYDGNKDAYKSFLLLDISGERYGMRREEERGHGEKVKSGRCLEEMEKNTFLQKNNHRDWLINLFGKKANPFHI
ncbi:hypothetical protein JTE90_018139 [Oedothorax gibbosus]|uniref:Uncharacterized protein n=1 Tax=Oedothorax gibbosus TaxID=931172 RepID=A0AAV6UZ30_9ARAC|nr:hypothetical protein JTE90_018139 [Oedothorax gibbosus]